ncbi:hypothetical protein MKW94_017307, partial [Papaver nudicaule]|nr:hypothetical protein [Papaver nudicaule]
MYFTSLKECLFPCLLYSYSLTEDLWAALEEGSGEPVNMLMNSWTKQMGYPVISIQLKDNKLEFDQNFLLRTKSESLNVVELLESSDVTGNHNQWIKLNVDQAGFYRVKYDDDLQLQARLRYAIEASSLSATNRFGILDDSYALSMACKQSLSSLFTLMSAYRKELDYTVLSHLITVSFKVATIMADAVPELSTYLKQFFINLFQSSAERLGWEPRQGESHLDAMLRREILIALAIFGHDLMINEAVRRFRAFADDRNSPLLPPDSRKAAYVTVMQTVIASNRWGYDALLKIYRETDPSQEKTRILGSLASCPDPSIVLEVLNFVLSPE